MHLQPFGNCRLGKSFLKQPVYLVPASIQFMLTVFAPLNPAKFCPLCLLAGKGLFCPLADKVSLNFSRQAKGKCQHLALDILPKPIVVFYRPDLALFCHADVKDLHNHEEIPAQPRKLRTNDKVVFLDSPEQFPQLAFIVVFRTTDGFFNPSIDLESVLGAEVINLEPLVLYSLFVTADSDISVNHTAN